MQYDYLIVGAGFSGSILAERIASELNQTVLLVDKRDHIAGNAHDYRDENGILVHKYGPHIFHTNSLKVWKYLSQFTEWYPYIHRVKARVDDQLVSLPFNLYTLYEVFPENYAARLEALLLKTFGIGQKIPILKLREISHPALKGLADYIYQFVFHGYTQKQWGFSPEHLDPSVTARVPFVIARDDRYFHDRFQGIPRDGYTEMFRRMLDHPNIHLLLNADYRDVLEEVRFNRMIYTGPIDLFFDYLHGELPYRSLRFELETYSTPYFQEVAQVNFPNHYDFTRITEFKHFLPHQTPVTTIAREFSQPHLPGVNEPYYPIPMAKHHDIYRKYQEEANKLRGSVIFLGRLADYKYYNMDQIAARALHVFEKQIGKQKWATEILLPS